MTCRLPTAATLSMLLRPASSNDCTTFAATICQHTNNGLFLLGATDLNNNELSTFCNNACLLLQIGACESIPYINDYSVTHTI